jgi:hypothetical protein
VFLAVHATERYDWRIKEEHSGHSEHAMEETQSTLIPLPLEVEWDHEEERVQRVWCLGISDHVRGNNRFLLGILLHRLEDNTYTRLGVFSLSYDNIILELIHPPNVENIVTLPQVSDWYENGIWTAISIE